jgi:hypothetical protein
VPPWPRWPWARLSATELTRPPANPAAGGRGTLAAPETAHVRGAGAAAGEGSVSDVSSVSERAAADFYAPEIRDMLRSADGRGGSGVGPGAAGAAGAAAAGNQVSVRVSMADWTSDDSTSTYQRGRGRHWVPY